MRRFEPWFDEMRTSKFFRREYEEYYQQSVVGGVKPESPKAWAFGCFLAVMEEKVARATIAREARVNRRRVREVTSAIVKYGDYPT